MCSKSDFEKFWSMYKTQSKPKEYTSIKFCVTDNATYQTFNESFQKVPKSSSYNVERAIKQPISNLLSFLSIQMPKVISLTDIQVKQ